MMCGFVGITHYGAVGHASALVENGATVISHRGPDDAGTWHDETIALGFRRLSILDLTGGHQPMANERLGLVVVFNGEIYNHRELRRELETLGCRFETDHSDTEVLLHGYAIWGEDLVHRLNGMFAFAIWRKRDRTLFLARDRFGIKPLYIAEPKTGLWVFASEIKAILATGLVEKRENQNAVLEYLSFLNLMGHQTFFRGIWMYPPGHYSTITQGKERRSRYWDFQFNRNYAGTLEDASQHHRDLLLSAVQRQMQADVPVRTYLSGGIDSTAITAAAKQQVDHLDAYSCIFDLSEVGEDRFVDERNDSSLAAKALGVNHHVLELSGDTLSNSMDKIARALEEPRVGLAYVNYAIAARVAEDGKVVLSGTGGDELHGGYVTRYPRVVTGWRNILSRVRGSQPLKSFKDTLNIPFHRNEWAEAISESYRRQTDFDPADAIETLFQTAHPTAHPWDSIMYLDATTFLHGLLTVEDKLSMAHSLETRVPLLDNDLVDFALSLPWRYLNDGRTGKIVLRESTRPWIPDEIYRKPKMGFAPPDASWYRGPLRTWIHQRLLGPDSRIFDILEPKVIERILDDHNRGDANHLGKIWAMLNLDGWRRAF